MVSVEVEVSSTAVSPKGLVCVDNKLSRVKGLKIIPTN